jgi:hypothetical protein
VHTTGGGVLKDTMNFAKKIVCVARVQDCSTQKKKKLEKEKKKEKKTNKK